MPASWAARTVAFLAVYDDLSRLTEDRATPPSGGWGVVGSTVQAIVTTYNDRGLPAAVTSYDDDADRATGDVVNQVAYTYDGWGNVLTSAQAHSSAQVGDAPEVTYLYDNLARLSEVTYPFDPEGSLTPRVVGYKHGTDDSMDDRLSRVSAITNGSPSSTTHFADYAYLGAGTIIKSARPLVSGGLSLTYGASGSYNGLDQWGRIVDQLWANDSSVAKDDYKYGYDAAGNRTKRENVLADAASTNLSETYLYDEVYRLIGTDRGHFSGETFSKTSDYQDWTLDGMGNFSEFDEDSDQDGDVDLEQSREHNAANEITSLGGTSVAHDAAGNLTNDGTLKYKYDAWNRQTEVLNASDSPVASYAFDGLGRRVSKTPAGGQTTDYYYNEDWQVLEERTPSGSMTTVRQYVWDLSYVDSPVVRLSDMNDDGLADETLYYTWDANHNVTALVWAGGTVAERYVYEPYGRVTVCNATTWAAVSDGSDANSTNGDESAYSNEILYCGYRYDPETAVYAATTRATGNYHVRNREYVTTLGVFSTRDPAKADPNLYRYCRNNPTIYVDPSGASVYIEPIFSYHTKTELNKNAGKEVLASELGEFQERETETFVQGLLHALRQICPCVSVSATEVDADAFRKNRLSGFAKVRAGINARYKDEDSFCDCVQKHAAGCTLLHDLLVAKDEGGILRIKSTKEENGHWMRATGGLAGLIIWNWRYAGPVKEAPSTSNASVLAHEMAHAWQGMWVKDGVWQASGDSKTRMRVPEDQQKAREGGRRDYPRAGEGFAVRVENQVGYEMSTTRYHERGEPVPDDTGYKARERYTESDPTPAPKTKTVPYPTRKCFECGHGKCVKWFKELTTEEGWQ